MRRSRCAELISFTIELSCIILDITPIPFAGSTCSLANAINDKNIQGVVVNIAFLALDYFTLGQGHWIKSGTTNLPKLGKMTSRLKKIVQANKVGGKQYGSLRLTAK
jgi:hypothetical protein